MRPGMVKGEDIRVEYPLKLLLLQDEQMIEALTPDTPEEPLTDGIGARGGIRSCKNLDPTRLRNTGEVRPKLAIVITDEVLRSFAKGGGFPQLLCSPSVAGRSCDAHMDHSARVQFDDEDGKERPEKQIGDWEKITGPDLLRMSAQEGCPGLPRWSSRAHLFHVCLDRAFTDMDTELEPFATDPLRSPQPVIPGHVLDQGHSLFRDLRFERRRSGRVFPIELESLAMPPQERRLPEQSPARVSRSERLLPGVPGACDPFWYRWVVSRADGG
jgi:hypothetical protein